MIELKCDCLGFVPDVHPDAVLDIGFQRTFRIPDDGKTYPLPPGFGDFPLRHVDDHADRVPPAWLARGGVMLPMYQSEAMWLLFDPEYIHGRRRPATRSPSRWRPARSTRSPVRPGPTG